MVLALADVEDAVDPVGVDRRPAAPAVDDRERARADVEVAVSGPVLAGALDRQLVALAARQDDRVRAPVGVRGDDRLAQRAVLGRAAVRLRVVARVHLVGARLGRRDGGQDEAQGEQKRVADRSHDRRSTLHMIWRNGGGLARPVPTCLRPLRPRAFRGDARAVRGGRGGLRRAAELRVGHLSRPRRLPRADRALGHLLVGDGDHAAVDGPRRRLGARAGSSTTGARATATSRSRQPSWELSLWRDGQVRRYEVYWDPDQGRAAFAEHGLQGPAQT